MHAEPHIATQAGLAASASAKPVLWLLLLVVAIVALFAPTAWSMLQIWQRSETFSHGFLVLPAFFYFVWQRRVQLAALPAKPFLPALIGVAAAAFVWLLAELASTTSPAQFAVVAMVPLGVLALFGWAWLRALAFPLAFLFFAVPFGDVFVPVLINWTADFTVAALKLSGVPVYREGSFFVIPSGRWSVVEACSGMRYLLASLMAGSLYALLMYRSTKRRVLFFLAALLVPLVANWVRAYGIVMLGHLSDNRIATGVDHLIYGWIFFGLVMGAMFWIGARWREDGAAVQAIAPVAQTRNTRGFAVTAVFALLLAAAGPLANAALKRTPSAQAAATLPTLAGANGWQAQAPVDWNWSPKLQGASSQSLQYFTKDGKTLALFVGLYRDQREGAELVSSANVLVAEDDPLWRVAQQRVLALSIDNSTVQTRALLARRTGAAAVNGLAIAQWYWLGASATSSDAQAKIELALDRLLLRDDSSAWIAVYTPAETSIAEAQTLLQAFAADMGPALMQALRTQVQQ